MPEPFTSVRFIQDYKGDSQPGSLMDQAMLLTTTDDREIPFGQKLADAMAFLKGRIH